MQLTTVEVDIEDGSAGGRAAHISLPGGELTAAAARELAAACESIQEDRSIRAVTLRARSGRFCTGPAADLDVFALRPDPASALARLRPPVIAAIDGECRAEGLEIVLAADIRIGTTASVYALDHVADGRVPAWGGTQRLPRAIGPGAAVAAALLGDELEAEAAKALGLLHSVADPLDAEIERLVEILLSRGPLALELTKEAIHRGSELPLRDGLRLEGDLNHQLAATEDRAEGLQAFFDKRPPDFSGR
ncbi:MAG: enoyl-CoA hydratase/isomerase family protein [Acidimicrobiales bacterium]